MFKRVVLLLLLAVLTLSGVVVVNTIRQPSRQLTIPPAAAIAVDEAGVAGRLAGAIQLRTISSLEDSTQNADAFLQLHSLLQTSFPRVHATLSREVIGFSLLYKWAGTDSTRPPILLMAHQDVVPVAPGTEADWLAEPFSGTIKDAFVWGRGAWDDKANLIAQLEAVEMLIASGFTPRSTVYLAFGADEEVGGDRGAVRIAALLKSRGVRFEFIIDEGLLITEGIMPGLSAPAALVGIAEKGYMSLKLKAQATPGHSSMPQPQGNNAIAILATVLSRLENEQMPARIQGVSRDMFAAVAPEIGGFNRIALSNLWLFGPLVQAQLEKASGTNATIRTTTAITIMQAGNKDNVIPGVAEAVVNFRLLPGDTKASVIEHVKSKIGNAPVEVSALPMSAEASPVSSITSPSFQLISRTVRALFPGTVVSPGLMVGATDARHFAEIADNVYRFSPVRARQEDLARFHGTNERISVANLADLVRFYHEVLRGAGAQ